MSPPIFCPFARQPRYQLAEDSHQSGEPMISSAWVFACLPYSFSSRIACSRQLPDRGYIEAAFFNGWSKIGVFRSRCNYFHVQPAS